MAEIVKNYSNGSSIKVVYSYTQDVNKNTSTVVMTLYVHRDSYGPSYNEHCNSYIQLDGSNVMTYTGSFNIGTSWVKIGSTVTKNVTHNADGSKSITLKGFFDSQGLTSKLDDLTVSDSITLKTIPRASSFSLSASKVTAGSTNMTVSITRASSKFTHTVQWKFGDHSKSTTGVSTSASYTIPESWLDAIPKATSGTGTVTVTTYNGSTKIGSASKNITVQAASDVVPTFTGISFTRVDGDVPTSWGIYVRGKSKTTAKITGASGVYGSTIKSYSISGGGYSASASSLTTGFLNTAGKITFTAKITDTRGRTATKTASINVENYSQPTISSASAKRCNEDGTSNADGNYIALTVKYSGTSFSGKNKIAGKYKYRQASGSWSDQQDIPSEEKKVFDASSDYTFSISIEVSDTFTKISKSLSVGSAKYIMDFKAGGTGLAIGKVAEEADCTDLRGFKKLYLPQYTYLGGMSMPEQKNLYFMSPEGSENYHQMKFYGGSATSTTGIGMQDEKNGAEIVWRYDDVDRYMRFYFPSYHNDMVHLKSQLRFLYGTETGWTAAIWQPSETNLRIGTKNGQGKTGFFDWIGEIGGEYRFILRPTENGQGYLGSTSYRWNTGFFTNTITQSDRKDKENVVPLDEKSVAFIRALCPVSYTLKNGEGGRTHLGLIAQDVAKIAKDTGMGDLSLYQAARVDKDGNESAYTPDAPDNELSWGLNYGELIAPLLRTVQQLLARVDEQAAQIEELKEQINNIQKGMVEDGKN